MDKEITITLPYKDFMYFIQLLKADRNKYVNDYICGHYDETIFKIADYRILELNELENRIRECL